MPPVTTLENADSRAFWDGVKAGRLVFQKCKTCGAVQFPPRYHCAACWASELENIDSSGRGSVESFTIVRRAPTAAYRESVPYVVAAITLQEGPRMITTVIGDDALDVQIGDPVIVEFRANPLGQQLPQFRRAGAN
jgi:uncharacterized OB-fold protein